MLEEGLIPTSETWAIVMHAHVTTGNWSRALELYDQVRACSCVYVGTIREGSLADDLPQTSRLKAHAAHRVDLSVVHSALEACFVRYPRLSCRDQH